MSDSCVSSLFYTASGCKKPEKVICRISSDQKALYCMIFSVTIANVKVSSA